MENTGTVKNHYFKITHLPTFMLLVGYPAYWTELFFINKHDGVTSLSAWVVFLLLAIFFAKNQENFLRSLFEMLRIQWRRGGLVGNGYFILSASVISFIILFVCRVSLLSPHLSQEFDALNYHITIPRQHLILGSFGHIPWSAADLFLLPVDFALAPYWLATELPNKFPQFLFLLGLLAMAVNLVKRFSSSNSLAIFIVVSAVLGSHFIGIQMGTAMLDIVIAYLFLAAIDSFLNRNILMASAEFAFFFWSKPFIPLQTVLLFGVMALIFITARIIGFANVKWCFGRVVGAAELSGYARIARKAAIPFILLSMFIAGPFMIKSFFCSGTPLFPFAPGIFGSGDTGLRDSLADSSQAHMNAKDAYGYGKSGLDFLKHFWLIAVPDRGVNNRYDYPLGLNYLIFLGPFIYLLYSALRKKEFTVLPLFSVAYWLLWWFGSQQSRFLYIPLLLMMIAVVSETRVHTKVFLAGIFLSLVVTGISILRANKNDLGLRPGEVLRPKDKRLVEMSRDYLAAGRSDTVALDYYDVAYARFPVMATAGEIGWVLKKE